MMITCAQCGVIFQSHALGEDVQTRESLKQLEAHVTKEHAALARERLQDPVQRLFLLCSTYVFLSNFAVIPEGENVLQKSMEVTRQGILEVLGIKVEEVLEPEIETEEGDDLEDDDDDDEDFEEEGEEKLTEPIQ